MGLGKATRKSGRRRAYSMQLIGSQKQSPIQIFIITDSSLEHAFCFFFEVGLGTWWYFLPGPLLVHPVACCSADYASAIKEALSEQACPMRHLGYLCTHQDHIYDKVMEAFTDSISLWNFFLFLFENIYFFF